MLARHGHAQKHPGPCSDVDCALLSWCRGDVLLLRMTAWQHYSRLMGSLPPPRMRTGIGRCSIWDQSPQTLRSPASCCSASVIILLRCCSFRDPSLPCFPTFRLPDPAPPCTACMIVCVSNVLPNAYRCGLADTTCVACSTSRFLQERFGMELTCSWSAIVTYFPADLASFL